MARSQRYVQASALLSRRTAGGVVLVVPGSDEIVRLFGTAAAIWDAFGTPTAVNEAMEALARSYGTEGSSISADVEQTVRDLTAKRVLVESP